MFGKKQDSFPFIKPKNIKVFPVVVATLFALVSPQIQSGEAVSKVATTVPSLRV